MKKIVIIASLFAASFQLNAEINAYGIQASENIIKSAEVLYKRFWNLDTPGMPSFSDPNEHFGHSVVSGNFNRDNYEDVAIGIPGYAGNIGAVVIMYGTASGLSATNSEIFFGNSSDDAFGYSLAVGDFNGDSFFSDDDLAIGIPFADTNSHVDAGMVRVFYGSNSGLSSSNFIDLTQGSGVHENNALMGWSLAAGYFNDDVYSELAISLPNKGIQAGSPPQIISEAGQVRVFNGSSTGLSGTNLSYLQQGSGGVAGVPEVGDKFGYSLTVGDFDRASKARGVGISNHDDLVVGVPFESFGATANGIVQIFMGGIGGLSYSRLLSQADSLDEDREDNDYFGLTLATGSLNGLFGVENEPDELIIGVPFEDLGSATDAGVVHVFYGSTTGITTVGNQLISQGSTSITGVPETGDNFGLALTVGNFDKATSFIDYYEDLVIGVPGESYQALRDGFVTIVYGSSTGADVSNSQSLFNVNAHDDTNYGLSLAAVGFGNYQSLIIGIPGQSSDGNLGAGLIEELGLEGNDIIFKHGFEQ